MKAHFIKMLDYDLFANDQIMQAITDAGAPAQSLKLMAHLLVAEQVWLNRCRKLPLSQYNLWPDDVTAEQCRQQISDHHKSWVNYLKTLTDEDFSNIIAYQDSAGRHHENLLSDIMAHLINHGTHTRAQIGQQLKFAGAKTLPCIDYCFYLRQ